MPTIDVKDAANITRTIEQPNANGRAAATASRPVALSTEDKIVLDAVATTVTLQGSLTETAPVSDTASSGLNGRLQRIAQRITSLLAVLPTALGAGGGIKVDGSGSPLPVSNTTLPLPTGASTEATLAAASGKLPATLGQKASAASLSVVVASDQSNVPVKSLLSPGVARQLTTVVTTVNTTLTVGIRAVSIFSRTSDARFRIGTGAQTATATSHYIAAGERLDFDTSGLAAPAIAIIFGPAAVATVLEISELN